MILAAFMVAGFGTACRLRRRDAARADATATTASASSIPFAMAAAIAPVQIGVGDWAAQFVADTSRSSWRRMEGLDETQRRARR